MNPIFEGLQRNEAFIRSHAKNGHIYVPTDWQMDAFPARRAGTKELDEAIRAKPPNMN